MEEDASQKEAVGLGLGWKNRNLHLAILILLLLGHSVVHYAILIPVVGELVEHLPFFNLHVLHESEYLVVIAYASLVFRLKGGVLALAATAVASTPFVFANRIHLSGAVDYGAMEYGFAGPENSLIEVSVLLLIGGFIVVVNEMWGRERDRRLLASQQLEAAHRQLLGLNQMIQKQINDTVVSIREAVEEENRALNSLDSSSMRSRFMAFLRKVAQIVGQ